MLAPTVDAQTRNGLVYVDLPAPGSARAGMFARGEIVTSRRNGVVRVLRGALGTGGMSTKLGAAKLTGTLGGRTTVGALVRGRVDAEREPVLRHLRVVARPPRGQRGPRGGNPAYKVLSSIVWFGALQNGSISSFSSL